MGSIAADGGSSGAISLRQTRGLGERLLKWDFVYFAYRQGVGRGKGGTSRKKVLEGKGTGRYLIRRDEYWKGF